MYASIDNKSSLVSDETLAPVDIFQEFGIIRESLEYMIFSEQILFGVIWEVKTSNTSQRKKLIH